MVDTLAIRSFTTDIEEMAKCLFAVGLLLKKLRILAPN